MELAAMITLAKALIAALREAGVFGKEQSEVESQIIERASALIVRESITRFTQLINDRANDLHREAARQNPAMAKRPPLAGLLLLAVMPWGVTGCASRVLPIAETDTTVAGYGVTWPTDASRNPADYATVEVDGRMVTTTPRANAPDFSPSVPATSISRPWRGEPAQEPCCER